MNDCGWGPFCPIHTVHDWPTYLHNGGDMGNLRDSARYAEHKWAGARGYFDPPQDHPNCKSSTTFTASTEPRKGYIDAGTYGERSELLINRQASRTELSGLVNDGWTLEPWRFPVQVEHPLFRFDAAAPVVPEAIPYTTGWRAVRVNSPVTITRMTEPDEEPPTTHVPRGFTFDAGMFRADEAAARYAQELNALRYRAAFGPVGPIAFGSLDVTS